MVRLLSGFPVMPCSRLSVPPLWEHTLDAQRLAPKEVPVPPLREPTILLVLILVQEQVIFLKPPALVLPMVKFGQPKSDRLGPIDTVDSDLMHHQFPFPFSVESRPGAQKSYQHCLRCLWKVSCGYSSRPRYLAPNSGQAAAASANCLHFTPGRRCADGFTL